MPGGYDPLGSAYRWAPRSRSAGPWAAGYEGMSGPWAPSQYRSYLPRVGVGRGGGAPAVEPRPAGPWAAGYEGMSGPWAPSQYRSYLPRVGVGRGAVGAGGGEGVDPWGRVEGERKVGKVPVGGGAELGLGGPGVGAGGGGDYGGGWYGEFRGEHGGATPGDYYGERANPWERREGLAEALADLEWSQGFERMYGRKPGDDDWRAWWFHSRGGGNFGARDRYRDVKGASNIEYKRMREGAETPQDERELRQYRAWSGGAGYDQLWYEGRLTPGSSRWESFVRDRGMTPEEYYLGPATGSGWAEQGGKPAYEVNPGSGGGGWRMGGAPGGDRPADATWGAPGGDRPAGATWGGTGMELVPKGVAPGGLDVDMDEGGDVWEDEEYGMQLPQEPRPPLWVPPQVYWRL